LNIPVRRLPIPTFRKIEHAAVVDDPIDEIAETAAHEHHPRRSTPCHDVCSNTVNPRDTLGNAV
jgi:hypothetical protein